MIFIRKHGDQIAEHMRGRRKAVQEQNGGSVPGTGFSIEDFQPLHVKRTIENGRRNLVRHRPQVEFPISMIPNGVSVLRSRATVYPMHDEEVGLIEGKESGSLLIRQRASGRSLRSTFLSLRLVPRLDGMRVDDCPN